MMMKMMIIILRIVMIMMVMIVMMMMMVVMIGLMIMTLLMTFASRKCIIFKGSISYHSSFAFLILPVHCSLMNDTKSTSLQKIDSNTANKQMPPMQT